MTVALACHPSPSLSQTAMPNPIAASSVWMFCMYTYESWMGLLVHVLRVYVCYSRVLVTSPDGPALDPTSSGTCETTTSPLRPVATTRFQLAAISDLHQYYQKLLTGRLDDELQLVSENNVIHVYIVCQPTGMSGTFLCLLLLVQFQWYSRLHYISVHHYNHKLGQT